MKEVILHIGMPKTGTITIQIAFKWYMAKNRKSVVKYAFFPIRNHSIPMLTIFSNNPTEKSIWRTRDISKSEMSLRKDSYIEMLARDLDDSSTEKLIISGEGISTLTNAEKAELVRFIEAKGWSVKVIMMCRDPIKFALSSNQQIAKNRATSLRKINPHFHSRLKGFLNVLPKGNISVYDFDSISKDVGLIQHFSSLLGVQLEEPPRANASVSLQALSLLYAFNEMMPRTKRSPSVIESRRRVVKEIRSVFSVANGCDKLETASPTEILAQGSYEECNWLFEKFGIKYNIEQNQIQKISLTEQLLSCLDGHEDKLVILFRNIDFEYSPQLGVSENFRLAFERLQGL